MNTCVNCGKEIRPHLTRCWLCREFLRRFGYDRQPDPTVVNLHFGGRILASVQTTDEEDDAVREARSEQAACRGVPIAAIVPVVRVWRPVPMRKK